MKTAKIRKRPSEAKQAKAAAGPRFWVRKANPELDRSGAWLLENWLKISEATKEKNESVPPRPAVERRAVAAVVENGNESLGDRSGSGFYGYAEIHEND